jgi:hypothetical protein
MTLFNGTRGLFALHFFTLFIFPSTAVDARMLFSLAAAGLHLCASDLATASSRSCRGEQPSPPPPNPEFAFDMHTFCLPCAVRFGSPSPEFWIAYLTCLLLQQLRVLCFLLQVELSSSERCWVKGEGSVLFQPNLSIQQLRAGQGWVWVWVQA